MRSIFTLFFYALSLCIVAQPVLVEQSKGASNHGKGGVQTPPTFRTICQVPITSIKDQHRSGTCWDYATLAFFESEILRKTGQSYDLCEMFVAAKDYMDCATHYVRMHGLSDFTEGGSADDVLEVLRVYGICPEEAMPAPGSLVGDTLANFETFFPQLTSLVKDIIVPDARMPEEGWREMVQAFIDKHLGVCPESFEYNGKQYTPRTFADALGLEWDDYVSLTSFTHHPFSRWFVIEAPYKWRLKPSYNIPVDDLMDVLQRAITHGYPVAWGGDVSGDFSIKGLGQLTDGAVVSQARRQSLFDDWTFTYDHVMLIYGIATDQDGNRYYMVKNSWGKKLGYAGTWYLSEDYIRQYTTYLFLNKRVLPKQLRREMQQHGF